MKAKSKTRGFDIKVCTTVNGRPTSGWQSSGNAFWRSLGDREGLFPNAMSMVPLENLKKQPDDWEVKP